MRGMVMFVATLVLLLVGCNSATPTIEGTLPVRTTTIAGLRDMVGTAKGVVIGDDVVIQGRVTSSDKEGNFSRSIIVEDDTGALEILVAERNLATIYPEGLLVALNLKGCAAGYNQGVLQVGSTTEEYEYYDVGYIETKELQQRIIRRSTSVERIIPGQRKIAELQRAECGRLIRIDELTLYHSTSIDTLEGMTLADATWQGYALFTDRHSDTIAVYTSPDATFANMPIATTPLSITGIQQWSKYDGGKECYHLKMRYSSDYENSY